MPNSYTDVYFPVLVQALIAMATAGGLLTVSFLLGKRIRNRVKDMPYESGIVPTGASCSIWKRFFCIRGWWCTAS